MVLAAGALATPAAAAEPAPDAWVSTNAEGYYRFTLPQAEVHELVGVHPSVVELQGNIGPAGTWSDLALDPSGSAYQGGFGPVEPGLYYYTYTATTADRAKVSFREPSSPVAVTSHPEWNTFFVPGPEVAWMADVDGGGEVSALTYRSEVTGSDRSALVWTHPEYDGERGRPAPVLYLLADEAQTHQEWTELGRVPQVLDNLAAEGSLEPMVVVMADVNTADPRAELVDSLVPAVERDYRVANEGRRQAVAGIGTGAEAALDVLLADPGRFGSVGSFSGALPDAPLTRATVNRVNARTDLLRVYVGNVLDPAYDATEAALRTLEAAGVRHQFDGVDPDQGGTWDTWREALHDFAPRLFQQGADDGPRAGHLPLDGPYEPPAPGSITTPHVDENGIVTFETGTQWADAKDVTVWGNWAPNGAWFRIPMEKVGDRWRLSLGPLDGFYYYRYVVDGVDHKDPVDTVNTLTGVSPLYVPGENDRLLADVPAGDGGDLSVLTYHSDFAGEERSAYVWTPPGYDPERAEAYPVLYLNHGGGQSWGDWVEVGRAPQILDNLSLQGEIEPMVVVMPNGNVPDYQAELFGNIVPATEAAYHVSADPEQRALAGLSLGAMNTLNTWLSHPGEFAYIGAFSGFVFGTPTFDADAVNAGTTLARMYTGDTSDFTYSFTMSLLEMLESRGVEHEFDGPTTGPHGFDTWQLNLIDFLPRLFTPEG
ncbi:alpha/beta hydrolase, partial [Cellulomonas carbonis]